MAEAWTIDDIGASALATAVDLLDALVDSCAMAVPGRDAAPYARDMRFLGEGAAVAVADLEALLTSAPSKRRVA
jgi:hypothetical protein